MAAHPGTAGLRILYANVPDLPRTREPWLLVALGAHDELVMHYVYDDGPGKTVHSYESVRFEFAEKRVTWTTRGDEGAARHTFEFARDHVAMKKEERDAHGTLTLRNEYAFTRP